MGEIYDTTSYSPARKRRVEFKSFFKWFRDYNDPLTDDIAEIFKDDIWTNPLQYFLVPDIESNDAGSSPSDNSEAEEPRRREKTERINSKSSNIRVKISTSTNPSTASELPTASSTVPGVSNETRSGDLGEACDGGVTPETGNTGDGESEASTPIVGTPPGPANVGGSRRRLFMSADYGMYSSG